MIIIGKKLDMEKLPESCYDCPFFEMGYDSSDVHCNLSFAINEIAKDQQSNYHIVHIRPASKLGSIEIPEQEYSYYELPDDKRLDSCPLVEVDLEVNHYGKRI